MENFQNLFDSGNFNELIEQTAETNDYNILFLRARAYIAMGDFKEAIRIFETAVAACGVWKECLGPSNAFQEEIGTQIAKRMRTYLEKAYDDFSARRLDDFTYENFNQAAAIGNTYDETLTQIKNVLTPICPMPSIMGAVGLPARSRAFSSFAEIWINAAEKMASRALTRWAKNADAILAEPEYRDATYGDIVYAHISCSNAIILMRLAGKDEYAKNIPQCDRAITLLIDILGTTVYIADGSMPFVQGDFREKLINTCKEAITWRKSIDAEYIPPQIPPQPPIMSNTPPAPTSQSSGGCYVATCVYGSYDCPQVWTLRRFRDNALAETWYGRTFIKAYYAISPILVKLFGQTKWFKNLWKPMLERMVKRLNASGVEDTPYNDRVW